MKRTRNFYVGVTIAAVIAVLAIAQYTLQTVARAQENGSANRAGIYEVDRMWPKPLPNNWVLGSTVGLAIDARDHVFIVHRGQSSLDQKFASQMAFDASRASRRRRPRGCAAPRRPAASRRRAPATRWPVTPQRHDQADFRVLLLGGAAGSRVRSGRQPRSSLGRARAPATSGRHRCTASRSTAKTTCGSPATAAHTILKFSKDGKFLLQIGKNGASKGNKDTANLNRPAEVEVDMAANEVYVADGYGNRRVIVYDADKGTFKRMWGAYGKPPTDDPNVTYDPTKPLSTNWQTVHCASLANDGLVYVCDRVNDRIQVFRKDGTYVKEAQIAKRTLGDGVTFDIAFSKDPQQRLMYVADGANHRVWQLLRDPMLVLNHIGNGGRYPGQFYATHNVSLDSKGNLYTVETYTGARLQKFTYKGLGAVAKPEGNHN